MSISDVTTGCTTTTSCTTDHRFYVDNTTRSGYNTWYMPEKNISREWAPYGDLYTDPLGHKWRREVEVEKLEKRIRLLEADQKAYKYLQKDYNRLTQELRKERDMSVKGSVVRAVDRDGDDCCHLCGAPLVKRETEDWREVKTKVDKDTDEETTQIIWHRQRDDHYECGTRRTYFPLDVDAKRKPKVKVGKDCIEIER